jgi:hypothetical protein
MATVLTSIEYAYKNLATQLKEKDASFQAVNAASFAGVKSEICRKVTKNVNMSTGF